MYLGINVRFSIIIPTYNEESDIAQTILSLFRMRYDSFEIIVVDDSTDRTPEILSSLAHDLLRVIRPQNKDGRSGARNIGIREARGDVVVILNADVHLPEDFLSRLERHYNEGADCVIVKSEVENLESPYSRYIEALTKLDYLGSNPQPMDWSEGFSCRRLVALEAGLFPTGFPLPLKSGEDKIFVENMMGNGVKQVHDLSIVCRHIAPATMLDFFKNRIERGEGSGVVKRFIRGWGSIRLALWILMRATHSLFSALILFPMCFRVFRLCLLSKRGGADFLFFVFAWTLERTAFCYGEMRIFLRSRSH